MRKVSLGNDGSIVVEMCFIMPIVFVIIMLLISTILRGINEGVALGTSQVMVYVYNDLDNKMESVDDDLARSIVLGDAEAMLKLREKEIQGVVKGSEYRMECVREWDLCTERLRRWQLYGDILWE